VTAAANPTRLHPIRIICGGGGGIGKCDDGDEFSWKKYNKKI